MSFKACIHSVDSSRPLLFVIVDLLRRPGGCPLYSPRNWSSSRIGWAGGPDDTQIARIEHEVEYGILLLVDYLHIMLATGVLTN